MGVTAKGDEQEKEKGKRGESKAFGKYDTVPSLFHSSQTASHLELINKLENLTRNKRGNGEEAGGVVSEGGPAMTHFPAICCSIPVFNLMCPFAAEAQGFPRPPPSCCSPPCNAPFRTSSGSSRRALRLIFLSNAASIFPIRSAF